MEKISQKENLLIKSVILTHSLIRLLLVFTGLLLIHIPFSQAAITYWGVCYDADWENRTGWYGTPLAKQQLKNLKKMGANSISVTPFAFQRNVNQPKIEFKPIINPGLQKDILTAQKMGFKIILKPHLWSNQFWDGSGNWRGTIEMKSEKDWAEWFLQYEQMITHFAKVAAKLEVDMLVIGLEFVKATQNRAPQWKKIIHSVREIYKGPLVYGANNFKEAEQIGFWKELDFIGINAYFPLAKTNKPTLEELKKSWGRHKENLKSLSRRNGQMKIILTEVGYASAEGTAKAPHQWPQKGTLIDEKEQADCYEALFSVLQDSPWMEGLFIWKYKIHTTPPHLSREPGESYFVFQNKPAQKIIEHHFKRMSKRIQTGSAP